MQIERWQRFRNTLAYALIAVGLLAPNVGAQVQSSQLQFDLRTGGDPFTFPPHRGVPIRIHTLFGAQCERWNMQVRSSSLTGGVTQCIGGVRNPTATSAECMIDTGSAEGPKQVVAQCTTADGKVLERTQLVSVRAGVTPPADSIPFGAPPVAGAPGANPSAEAPAAPKAAARAGGSSGAGTALAVGAVLAGTAAAIGLAAAAASSGGGGGDSCPTAACTSGGGFCAWPSNCPCPSGSTGVGGACPANFGGTPSGTKHCLC